MIANYKLIVANKTPLKLTGRFKRLFAISTLILLTCVFCVLGVGLICTILPLLPFISNKLNLYDYIKNQQYIKKAKNKLKAINPKIIAITGSNGKTSIKNILLAMLSDCNAYATPKSYNTPLGTASFINNQLKSDCKFLILEYGARHIGDVKEMCELFGADYGVCSLVTTQHIETFKNIGNIYKTKKELSDFLKNNFCAFNLNNKYTNKMYLLKAGSKGGVYLLDENEQDFDLNNLSKNIIVAKNVEIEDFITKFDLVINNCTYPCKTKLLGRHNVTNIMLATSVAVELGVDINKIINTISNLNYTPHRLEYIAGRINILDDSYNCSIESAKESLWVLSKTKGKRMVCTPGIIEAGKQSFEINFKLGKLLAASSFVVIVGKTNKSAILSGLESKNFKAKNIFFANNLEEAKQYFFKLNQNDTLLLLNDLPDDYY